MDGNTKKQVSFLDTCFLYIERLVLDVDLVVVGMESEEAGCQPVESLE